MQQRISEEELIAQSISNFKSSLNIAIPGTIVSFNSVTTRAVVRLAIQRVPILGEAYTIADLHEVPVFIQQSGGFSITIPIRIGDECMVMFAHRDISEWKIDGGEVPPYSERVLDLSDGFCIVGYQSSKRVVEEYNEDAIELRSSGASMAITEESIDVEVGSTLFNITEDGVDIEGSLSVTGSIEGGSVATSGPDGVCLSVHVHPSDGTPPTPTPCPPVP